MTTVSFAELKKRQRSTSKEDLKNKLNKETKSEGKDNRFWKPTMIKSSKGGDVVGTSSDVIRFLPESYADLKLVAEGKFSELYLSPIFHRKHHAFQGPNGWYFEESRSMLIDENGSEEKCPVYERVKPMWDEAKETENKTRQNKLKEYFTKSEHLVNILVIKDGSNPENNGKVFLFKLTKAMKDKLDSCFESEFEDEETFNPFDLEEGRAFELKLEYKTKSFGNYTGPVADYTKSKFQSTSTPLADSEEEIDEIMEQAHSFFSYLSKVKSEKELNEKLDKVFSFKSEKADHSEKEPESYESGASNDDGNLDTDDEDLQQYKDLLNG